MTGWQVTVVMFTYSSCFYPTSEVPGFECFYLSFCISLTMFLSHNLYGNKRNVIASALTVINLIFPFQYFCACSLVRFACFARDPTDVAGRAVVLGVGVTRSLLQNIRKCKNHTKVTRGRINIHAWWHSYVVTFLHSNKKCQKNLSKIWNIHA